MDATGVGKRTIVLAGNPEFGCKDVRFFRCGMDAIGGGQKNNIALAGDPGFGSTRVIFF